MRQEDIALLKLLGELQAKAAKMVKDNLNISQVDLNRCLLKHLNFEEKNPENCTTAGMESSFKRGFSPKYRTQMSKALQGVIQELEDHRGKLLKKEQEEKLFDDICYLLDWANAAVQFIVGIDEYFIPNNFRSPEMVKDLDPRFVYALNKSFEAFKTLSEYDVYFLSIHQRKDLREKVRGILNQYMDLLPLEIGQNYANRVTAEWMQARKQFLFKQRKEKILIYDEWRIFIDKFNRLKSFAIINDFNQKNLGKSPIEIYKRLIVVLVLKVIWPKKGHTNTNFKPEDIDALLVFKNCLSTKNQMLLLDEFKDIFE